jgi:arginine/lysine/ornithine decarboxylase
MDELYDKLVKYSKKDYYPMHMPGHKRNTSMLSMENPYAIDITEIPGFDNLHQPEDILRVLSERISRIYHSNKAFPLVNGSTAGLLAGISAATYRGDKVLVARNCHKAVYHAISMKQLKPVYIYPQMAEQISINCGISPEKIEEALIKNPDIKLIIITSPTYEGVVSDIRRIADIAHRYKAVLLVDEAHGAHFGFHDGFPKSAVTLGADLVIQSLHKTLPAFTQTAVLHSNLPELNRRIRKYLSVYQSSSPSYLLMAGIDRCIRLIEEQGKCLFDTYYARLALFYRSMEQLRNLKLLTGDIRGNYGVYDWDPSKITVFTSNTSWNGHQLGEHLREKYHIVVEMESRDYILGMTSICDTEEGLERFTKALLSIDRELDNYNQGKEKKPAGNASFARPVMQRYPYEALEHGTEVIQLEDSCGRICADFISMYPPGTPLLVSGERIERDFIDIITRAIEDGFTVTGLSGGGKEEIEVMI